MAYDFVEPGLISFMLCATHLDDLEADLLVALGEVDADLLLAMRPRERVLPDDVFVDAEVVRERRELEYARVVGSSAGRDARKAGDCQESH